MGGKVCREVRQEIDQSELRESLSANAAAHVAGCVTCAEFHEQRLRLRELVGTLKPVTAPADFDMRLRARMARERDAQRQPFISRFVMSTPGIVLAAALVLVVGTVVFVGQRNRSHAPQLASGNGNEHAVTPSPAPVIAAKDENSEAPESTAPVSEVTGKRKQSAVVVRNNGRAIPPVNTAPQAEDFSSRAAQPIQRANRAGEVSLSAPVKPLIVTMYDQHGGTKKIQLPPISFGSQRLTDNRAPVSMTNTKAW